MICINISEHLQTALKDKVFSNLTDSGVVVVFVNILGHL